MAIKFDLNGNAEPFTLILCRRNHSVYGSINTAVNLVFLDNLQPNREINFTVHKEIQAGSQVITCNVWQDIQDLRYVYIPEIDEYFEIHVPITDSGEVTKTVTGSNAAVSELSHVMLYDIQINTEDDIAREDYEATVFYSSASPKASLLHRIFEKAGHYSIKHVDASLSKIKRTFSVSDSSLYDFCTQALSEEIGCLFSFDSSERTVSVFDLWNTCQDCGYRGEFIDTCPECQKTNILTGYGRDTSIFVSKENLADSVSLESNQEEIKNCFKVEGGDELVTAAIVNSIPNGSNYIYYFSEEMQRDMSPELAGKLNSYQTLCDSYAAECAKLTTDIYDCYDKEAKLTSTMMPTVETAETNAAKQLALLTTAALSPVAVTDVSRISAATADSAVLGMAKVICSTNFKIEIVSSSLASQTWKGIFQVTNYSDKTDKAVSASPIPVTVNDDFEKYIQQKLDKAMHKEDTDGLSDLLAIKDLAAFSKELKKYCKNRLISFADAFQSCMEILAEQKCGDAAAYPDLYQKLYLPFYNKHRAITAEQVLRDAQIKAVLVQREKLEKRQSSIQTALDFEHYLGAPLQKEFYAHRRESKYSNSNYISDGLTNAELLKTAQELIATAKAELKKSAEKKYTLNASMANLLKSREFRPLLLDFKCGNWIRIQVDGTIFKLRILSYQISFDSGENGTNIDVTFSDVSKRNDLSAEINSILSQAKSMAGSYSYVSRQAEKGETAKTSIDDMRTHGLYLSNLMVTNADTEDIVYGKNGILCRSYDDITGEYEPTQLKIIHNTINITDDGWRTSRLSLGENIINGTKYFGLFADFVNAGKVWGTDIIGGTITGTSFNNGNGTFLVDKEGRLKASSATINGIITAKAGSQIGGFEITDTAILNTKTSLTDTSNGVYLGTDGIALGNNNNFIVKNNGELTADMGHLARFNFGAGWFFNGVSIGESPTSCGMSAGTSLGGNDDWIFWAGDGRFRVDINGNSFCQNLNISGGSINISDSFTVDSVGTCTANYCNINAGRLGSWNLVDGWIISEGFVTGLSSGSGTDGVIFWTGNTQGHANIGSAPFLIKNDGSMYANYIEADRIVSYDSSGRALSLAPTLRNVLDMAAFPSDAKLKYGIRNSSVTALSYVNQIQHREFYWKNNQGYQQLGYVAQELKKIDSSFSCSFCNPDPLSGEETYTEQVSMQGIFPYITKSIQELSHKFDDLQEQLNRIVKLNS